VPEIAGLPAPVVVNQHVRAMFPVDQDAIRACTDADALQRLRVQLLAAQRGKWAIPMGLASAVASFIILVQLLSNVNPDVIKAVAIVLIGLSLANVGYRARVRERTHGSAEWLSTIDKRLGWLAVQGD